MEERRDDQRQEVKRHSVMTGRDCVIGVISFNNLEWSQYFAKVIDLSITGLGIESDQSLEPGLVWFKECPYGQKFGFLVWCKQHGQRYRAGIEFISLSRAEEDYLRQRLQLPHRPIQDPDGRISSIIRKHKINIDARINVNK